MPTENISTHTDRHAIRLTYLSQEALLQAGCLDFRLAIDTAKKAILAHRNGETWYSKPKDYFAHAGKLAPMLLAGHPDKHGNPRLQLDGQSFQRIVDWLDLNGQFYGDYSFNRLEDHAPVRDAEQRLREFVTRRFGSDIAREPYAALVNKVLPEESRILKAPLSVEAGGWGQIPGGWASTNDPGYEQMLQLIFRDFMWFWLNIWPERLNCLIVVFR